MSSTDPNGNPSQDQGTTTVGNMNDLNSPNVDIPDYGVDKGAKPPLSPEEYAEAKKEIEKEGDHNQSGHKNG